MFTLRESRRGDHELCEHGSDRRETSAKRVSDDLQLSIFSRRIFFFEFFFGFFSVFLNFRQILKELGIFGCQNQIARCILLQVVKISGPLDVSGGQHEPKGLGIGRQ